MAIKRLEALELADLLGSLLGSVVDAQAQSARATVAFVEDVGYEATSEGNKLRTVQLRYTKKDENGEPAEFVVEVPLLSMVNVPSLAVREATLSFSYDVVSAAAGDGGSGETSPSTLTGSSPSTAGVVKAAKLRGYVRTTSPDNKGSSVRKTTSIDIKVSLEQQDVPIGVERMFDLAEMGIIEAKADDS